MQLIGVSTEQPELQLQTQALSLQLTIPMAQESEQYQYLLRVTSTGLALHSTQTSMSPLLIDFLDPNFLRRLSPPALNAETLIKMTGKKANTVIDTTLGLGRDSFLLAAKGFQVTAFERSPILFALVNSGLQHALTQTVTCDIAKRIQLIQGSAIELLNQHHADIIYLDPMHPPRKKKSALVKKEMRIIRDLVGDDTDSKQLLSLARQQAKKRVIVKLPMYADYLSDDKPSFSNEGKTTRFDIYCIT